MGDPAQRSSRKRRDSGAPKDVLDLFPRTPEVKNSKKAKSQRPSLVATNSQVTSKTKKPTPQKLVRITPKKTVEPQTTRVAESKTPPKKVAEPKTSRKSIEAKETNSEVEKLVRRTERLEEYEDIIAKKDAAYNALYTQFQQLKARGQEQVFADFSATFQKNDQAATESVQRLTASASNAHSQLKLRIKEVEDLKKQAVIARLAAEKQEKNVAELVNTNTRLLAELKQARDKCETTEKQAAELSASQSKFQKEVDRKTDAKSEKEVAELTKANTKLQKELTQALEKITSLERVEETYRLLSATEITHHKGDLFRCKLVGREPYRVIDFELGSGEEITFHANRVKLTGKAVPDFMKLRVKFPPVQAPLLMRQMLGLIYDRTAQKPSVFSPTTLR